MTGASVQPGRFANVVRRTGTAVHALQHVREAMKSSFVLWLDPDGSARLCRGWRSLSHNDGPTVQGAEKLAEQLGYRGHWRRTGGGVHIALRLDDGACPRVAQYSSLVPHHRADWRLRCAMLAPDRSPAPDVPLLACRLDPPEQQFGEDEPHCVSLEDGPLILLAGGNGLSIEASFDPTGVTPPPPPTIAQAAQQIDYDEWQRP
jgi:hypothetical protein